MNILDILRANPAAVGASITGYGPDNTPFPVPPPRPAQSVIDGLTASPGEPTQLASAPKGNVLAVIDPTRARQQEESGLLKQVSDALTSGGLTADGKGRSKWGAFANGLASGLNHQGAMRASRDKTAREEAKWRTELGIKQQNSDQLGQYYKTLGDVAQRRQAWNETPDAPGTEAGNLGELRLENLKIRWRSNRARELGISFREDPLATEEQKAARRAALAQIDEEEADPRHAWNRLRAPAGGATPPATPPAAGAGATPATPVTPPAGAPAPSPAPAPAPAPATPRRITNRAEYDSLQSGEVYFAPDGSQRTKP